MLPLVSIVTPSYNQGRFLRRTIDSVLNQDYPRVEYLVFDGGSTDESIDILNSYGNRFFWRSERDRGQTDAINKGLLRANGDILAYLNSDDVLLPGAIATAVKHFESRADWELLYGNAYHIDEDDHVLGEYPTAPYDFDRLLQSCCICQPAAFWRRSLSEHVGLFDDTLHCAMDYEYWLRIGRFSQYYAYWHHRCHERATGWPRLLRWVPECHWWLAWAHRRFQSRRSRLSVRAAPGER